MHHRRMKPFHAIAIPHKNIIAGRISMETFATDLWEVSRGRGAEPYASRTEFFDNTYQSEGLKHVLSNADARLQGQGGDAVIQLKAPFGAGKTHSLIALYYYVETMDVTQAVIVGTAVTATETLWGLLEKQLSGEVAQFSAATSPGREAIRELLATHQPVNILIDKVSEYVTKAAAIPVGESTLAAQTLLFFQELSEAVSSLDNAMLVFTLPSGSLEQYDEQSKWFFEHIQKITGRVERIHTLLQDQEVAPLIRQRLFSKVKPRSVKNAVAEFLEYARQEALLPAGIDPHVYGRRFEASYPFLPEMLDVLYHRWGQYPAFQRVRGMLRLLSLVLGKCHQQSLPYITLADIDLADPNVRYELLHHIGTGVEKMIFDDIVTETAGAKMVDTELTDMSISLATRAATTIFLYSFPDDAQRGASFGELKRHTLLPGIPANTLVNILQPLKNRLLYLQHERDRLYFGTQITLNRLLLKKLDTIEEQALEELERELLHKEFPEEHFQVFPDYVHHSDIPDNEKLKLLILKERDETRMTEIVLKHGDLSRINRNTLLFLVPANGEREAFLTFLRQFLALGMLLADSADDISDAHRTEVRSRWRNMEFDLTIALRKCYRMVLIPGQQDMKERELAISISEGHQKLEQQVYDLLTTEGDIVKRIASTTIRDVYLRDKPFVFTEQLLRFNATTLGEPHVANRNGWYEGINLGVQEGIFGLGILKQRSPVCVCYKKPVPYVDLSGNEVLIRQDLCEVQQSEIIQEQAKAVQEGEIREKPGASERFEARLKERKHAISDKSEQQPPQAEEQLPESESVQEPPEKPESTVITSPVIASQKESKARSGSRKEIHLRFDVPQGNVTDLMSIIYSLRHKFGKITLEIHAEQGGMTAHEYQMNVQEILRGMGVFIEEAEIE